MYDESNDGKGGMRQHLGMLQDLLSSLFERRSEANVVADARSLDVLCEELLTGKGEVSGYRLAQIILGRIDALDDQEISEFFLLLTNRFDIDAAAVLEAGNRYRQERSAENLAELMAAAEPKRQELLRRLNQFPGATARLVALREKLLAMAKSEAALNRVDLDFQRLFNSWFNRGFLVLRRIDWQTPANILEKIIQYEAVHEIDDWEDLRRRLQPEDRRCYGFFHPSMPNDPLIFVEVALSDDVPSSIQAILSTDREIMRQSSANTAVFYSISTCQKGLQGISFGNFLIKQVVQHLKQELPNLKRFITLSPMPKFLTWLARQTEADASLAESVTLARAGRQNRLYRIRHAIAKRHFHENQRIIRHQGVKKSVATAILRLQPPPQVFPIINLMNRFILNNLFKNIGRRLPVDPAQHQKSPIKPGIKEMPKIQIHPFQGFFRLGHDQQLFSQPHQPRRGVGKLIQSP